MAAADQSTNMNLFQSIAKYLTDMGLGGLFTLHERTDNKGNKVLIPGGWLWDQITSGVNDANVIQINLEQTQQFQQRYGIISELRKAALNDPQVHVPNVAEVREYEQTVSSIFRQANLPTFMYDNFSDIHAYMRLNLSAVEIEQRVGHTLDRVRNTDPLVRDVFGSWFGVVGDAALAATFLDPTKALSQLERMSRAAYTGGMGQRMGITVDQANAERIAGGPSTDAGIYQDLTTAAQITGSGILTEGISETNDLTDQTAIDSVFFGSGAAQSELERRQIERAANKASTAGGAVRTTRGITGLGVA